MTPMDRRGFLRSGTAVGALGLGVSPVVATTAAEARAAGRYRRRLPDGWTYPVAEELLPFGHGVMSGDPLADRVILWTRVTIPDARGWDSATVRDPQGRPASLVHNIQRGVRGDQQLERAGRIPVCRAM